MARNETATLITIDAKQFLQKVSALEGSHLIRFNSSADEVANKVALVKETQYHPVTGAVLHADFYEVDMAAKAAGARAAPLHRQSRRGGAWAASFSPCNVTSKWNACRRTSPSSSTSMSPRLNIHDAVHVSQLQAPEGVSVLYDADATLVTVLPPTVEEVKIAEAATAEAAGEAAPAAEGAKPEAEKKGGAS